MIYYENIEEWYKLYTSRKKIDLRFIIESVANVLYDIYYKELENFESDEEDNDLLRSNFLSDETVKRIMQIISYYLYYDKELFNAKNKKDLLFLVISITYLVLNINYLEYFQHGIITPKKIVNHMKDKMNLKLEYELTKYVNEITMKDTYIFSKIRRKILGFC